MNDNFVMFLKQNFEDLESFDTEKLLRVTTESATYFNSLKAVLASTDEEAKKAAHREATEIKDYLEQRMQQLSEITGMDYQQITELAENPSLLSPEMREELAQVTYNINSIKKNEVVNNRKINPKFMR